MTDAQRNLTEPVVRARTAADLDACLRVLAVVHARDAYPLNWPADPAGWLSPSTLRAVWVAELDGLPVGHVAACGSDGDDCARLWAERAGASESEAAVVSRLFVDPSARGHQIGAALLTALDTWSRAAGLHPVLDVVSSDTTAARLYERLGWTRLGTTTQHWSGHAVTLHSYAAP